MPAGLTRRQPMFREIFEEGIIFRASGNVTIFTQSAPPTVLLRWQPNNN